jgi:hypothetical protein
MAINFDNLVIDRVVAGWFENKDNEVLAVLDQITNFSVNTSSETKDKTDAQGTLLKRFYTAKTVEISGENAVFSMNLHAIQTGTDKKTGTQVVLPRIIQYAKTDSPITLPDAGIDVTTLVVVGTTENGLPDVALQYEKAAEAAAGKYAVAVDQETGVATLTLPTDASDLVQVKYEFTVAADKAAARVDQTGDHFPKECKATFEVLCSDICDTETVRALYIVFPKFQMSPDVDLTFDTESTQAFSATALKDYCGKGQILYYIAIVEDSDEYDTKQYA